MCCAAHYTTFTLPKTISLTVCWVVSSGSLGRNGCDINTCEWGQDTVKNNGVLLPYGRGKSNICH